MSVPVPGVYLDRDGDVIRVSLRGQVLPADLHTPAEYAEKFGPLTPLVPLPDRETLAVYLYRRYNPGLLMPFSALSDRDQLRGLADADAIIAMLTGQMQL